MKCITPLPSLHMIRTLSRSLAIAAMATSVATAQTRRVFTNADYDRAARMLGPSLNGLVVGGNVQPTWMPDGRFWYRSQLLPDTQYVVIDPSKATRTVMDGAPPAGGT